MDFFICYETITGVSYARHIKRALEKIGQSAFVAAEDIPGGATWREVIDEAIKDCKDFILIMTSLAVQSPEVKREIELARKLDKNIIPCRPSYVDSFNFSMFPVVRPLHRLDYDDKENLADKLIATIKKRKKITELPTIHMEAPETIPLPKENERRAEFNNVRSAVIAMMIANNLTRIPNPHDYAGGSAYNDMTAFPDSTSAAASADKQADPQGYKYEATTDKDGYILYGHDITGGAAADPNPNQEDLNYIPQDTTKYYYTCEADGTVRQFADAALTTEYVD
jgi:hypothetical protein